MRHLQEQAESRAGWKAPRGPFSLGLQFAFLQSPGPALRLNLTCSRRHRVAWTILNWLPLPLAHLAGSRASQAGSLGLSCGPAWPGYIPWCFSYQGQAWSAVAPSQSSLPPLLCLWMTSGHSFICVPGTGSCDSTVPGGTRELLSTKQWLEPESASVSASSCKQVMQSPTGVLY